jgi:hypothetical protein
VDQYEDLGSGLRKSQGRTFPLEELARNGCCVGKVACTQPYRLGCGREPHVSDLKEEAGGPHPGRDMHHSEAPTPGSTTESCWSRDGNHTMSLKCARAKHD